jgi:hypothetical protein
MIHLTFYHARNVFNEKGEFADWITKNFPSSEFVGFEYGQYRPTIKMSLPEFEKGRSVIPSVNIIRIEGKPTILETLVYNVRAFKNEIEMSDEQKNREYLPIEALETQLNQ